MIQPQAATTLTPTAGGHLGLSAETLSDIIGKLDWSFDAKAGTVAVSRKPLQVDGTRVKINSFMFGIPILKVHADDEAARRFFFDTGAAVSYWQNERIESHAQAGVYQDYFPGFGSFETQTFRVPFRLETVGDDDAVVTPLRTGTLPKALAGIVKGIKCEGIIGNEVLLNRTFGYFRRRRLIVLGSHGLD